MKFSVDAEFRGFMATPQLFKSSKAPFPLYRTIEVDQPEIKIEEISAPYTVLGKRMEIMFSNYIRLISRDKIILQNQQIILEKQTLGELDFLIQEEDQQEITHVELIFKFYVFDPETGTSELEHVIGPNRRDSLNKKLEKLKENQFPILFHSAVAPILKPLGVDPKKVVQKMCFKALIFTPRNRTPELSFLNSDSIGGFWIKHSEFLKSEFDNHQFFLPEKKYWPVDPTENAEWYCFETLGHLIKPLLEKKFSPLVWMRSVHGVHQRFFVVWW